MARMNWVEYEAMRILARRGPLRIEAVAQALRWNCVEATRLLLERAARKLVFGGGAHGVSAAPAPVLIRELRNGERYVGLSAPARAAFDGGTFAPPGSARPTRPNGSARDHRQETGPAPAVESGPARVSRSAPAVWAWTPRPRSDPAFAEPSEPLPQTGFRA